MRRAPLVRKPPDEAKTSVPIHRRKCKVCKEPFTTFKTMQVVCGWLCAAEWTKRRAEREAKEKVKAQRQSDKKKREDLKTIPQLTKEAQREFNKYVRLRDAGRPCISCGRNMQGGGRGGGIDAGHFRSTGAAPHLRFHEDNCHAQCKFCNQFRAGAVSDYRQGLLLRIGVERLESLEANNQTTKWTREALQEIRDTYRAKAKELGK